MDKPIEDLKWADITDTDPIALCLNKIEPPTSVKETGLKAGKKRVVVTWQNWWFNAVYKWINYLDFKKAAFSDGAARDEVDLPIGSVVFVEGVADRNADIDIYLEGTQSYKTTGITQLTGRWVARGIDGTHVLAQRVE